MSNTQSRTLKTSIYVLSIGATDYVYQENVILPVARKGGPALFIKKVFDSLGINYQIAKYKPAEIEIRVTTKGEEGRILESGRIFLPHKVETSNLLISTVAPSNLDLNFLRYYWGDVFLDLQGFVRDENNPNLGAKIIWQDEHSIIDRISVLKINSKEVCCMPENLLSKARNNSVVLETKGKEGLVLWGKGKKNFIPPSKVIETNESIGAGDTFFAAFVAQFIKSGNTLESVYFGLRIVENFLSNKLIMTAS